MVDTYRYRYHFLQIILLLIENKSIFFAHSVLLYVVLIKLVAGTILSVELVSIIGLNALEMKKI